jgi:hypothetical protein
MCNPREKKYGHYDGMPGNIHDTQQSRWLQIVTQYNDWNCDGCQPAQIAPVLDSCSSQMFVNFNLKGSIMNKLVAALIASVFAASAFAAGHSASPATGTHKADSKMHESDTKANKDAAKADEKAAKADAKADKQKAKADAKASKQKAEAKADKAEAKADAKADKAEAKTDKATSTTK